MKKTLLFLLLTVVGSAPWNRAPISRRVRSSPDLEAQSNDGITVDNRDVAYNASRFREEIMTHAPHTRIVGVAGACCAVLAVVAPAIHGQTASRCPGTVIAWVETDCAPGSNRRRAVFAAFH